MNPGPTIMHGSFRSYNIPLSFYICNSVWLMRLGCLILFILRFGQWLAITQLLKHDPAPWTAWILGGVFNMHFISIPLDGLFEYAGDNVQHMCLGFNSEVIAVEIAQGLSRLCPFSFVIPVSTIFCGRRLVVVRRSVKTYMRRCSPASTFIKA